MSIEAISAIGSGLATTGVETTAAPVAGSGDSFANALGGAIDSLQAMQSESKTLAIKAVTGDLDDVHDYTIAAAKASTALELTAAVRNKAVEAFSEIMRMQA